MVVLTPIERETLKGLLFYFFIFYFYTYFSDAQCVHFGNTADIYAIVYFVPNACQHITIDQRHNSGDTVAKTWRLARSGGTKTVSFTNP